MLSDRERQFLNCARVGHLATADRSGVPHVVPVCFAIADRNLYVTIDKKPKRAPGGKLKRLRNIEQNPNVAFVVDRYAEDWSLLGWVMLRGSADVLIDGSEHDDAQSRLRDRYSQLATMRIEILPVIAVRVERVTSWGNLDVAGSLEPAGRRTVVPGRSIR